MMKTAVTTCKEVRGEDECKMLNMLPDGWQVPPNRVQGTLLGSPRNKRMDKDVTAALKDPRFEEMEYTQSSSL